jgi:hypothetical protein
MIDDRSNRSNIVTFRALGGGGSRKKLAHIALISKYVQVRTHPQLRYSYEITHHIQLSCGSKITHTRLLIEPCDQF